MSWDISAHTSAWIHWVYISPPGGDATVLLQLSQLGEPGPGRRHAVALLPLVEGVGEAHVGAQLVAARLGRHQLHHLGRVEPGVGPERHHDSGRAELVAEGA